MIPGSFTHEDDEARRAFLCGVEECPEDEAPRLNARAAAGPGTAQRVTCGIMGVPDLVVAGRRLDARGGGGVSHAHA